MQRASDHESLTSISWFIHLRFPTTGSPHITLKRYWYYYLLDGYFLSYDPSSPMVKSKDGIHTKHGLVQTLNFIDLERRPTTQDQLKHGDSNQPPIQMPRPCYKPLLLCSSVYSCYSDIATIGSSRLTVCTWSSESDKSEAGESPIAAGAEIAN